MALNRLQKELKDMTARSPEGISAGVKSEKDMFEWTATMVGPKGTPYADGLFHLDIKFPKNYPFAPPKITFRTKIYHCNISDGNICLDILKQTWSPALTIDKVLLSISSLLSEPNCNDPLSPEIAALYKSNKLEHDRIARETTVKYAIDK